MNTFKSFIEFYNPLNQTAKLSLFHVTFAPLENMGGYFAIVQEGSSEKEFILCPAMLPSGRFQRENRRQTAWPADPSARASCNLK